MVDQEKVNNNHLGLRLLFAHLNFRYNPFGELNPEERAELAVIGLDLEDYARRLARPGTAVQLITLFSYNFV